MYDFAVMMKQQMEDIGFVVDLQVVDWATLSTRRFNPKEYEVFTTGIGIGAQFDPCSRRSCPARGRAGPATRRSRRTPRSWRARPTRRSGAPCGSSRRGSGTTRCRRSAWGPPRAPSRAEDGQGTQRERRRPRFYNVWLEK